MRIIEKLQLEDMELINHLVNSNEFKGIPTVSCVEISVNLFKQLKKSHLEYLNEKGYDYCIQPYSKLLVIKRKVTSSYEIGYSINELGYTTEQIDSDEL